MSARLHLASSDDIDRLMTMVATYHASESIQSSETNRLLAIRPLLDGSPHGAIWLIGPKSAPVGYIIVTFGWSVELGGLEGFIDEFFVRDSIRGRGVGSEVLRALIDELQETGLAAMHLEVARDNDLAQRLFRRLGFRMRDGHHLMTWQAEAG